jgi:hypothetical protein
MAGLADVENVAPTACGNQVVGMRFLPWSFRSGCKHQVSSDADIKKCGGEVLLGLARSGQSRVQSTPAA